MPSSSTAPAGSDATAMLTSVHPDVIRTHILTRLDGPALVAATSASSQLHSLSSDDRLWQDVCVAAWPSVSDPRVAEAIAAFPSRHRSFFSDSYPILNHHKLQRRRSPPPAPLANCLISAVDVHYEDEPIFSKVRETETASGWFECSPFRVDLLDLKESVPTRIQKPGGMHDEAWLRHLEDNLSLSWILVDPAQRRSANLSTRRPVSVQRHWLTGDVQARYATVLAGGGPRGSATEHVQCTATVTCGGKEGGKLQVREVSFQVEDMEGKILNGKESLAILGEAMGSGERKKAKRETEGKERFEEYEERKRERKERKQRRERTLDLVCIAVGVTLFVGFWSFILFR